MKHSKGVYGILLGSLVVMGLMLVGCKKEPPAEADMSAPAAEVDEMIMLDVEPMPETSEPMNKQDIPEVGAPSEMPDNDTADDDVVVVEEEDVVVELPLVPDEADTESAPMAPKMDDEDHTTDSMGTTTPSTEDTINPEQDSAMKADTDKDTSKDTDNDTEKDEGNEAGKDDSKMISDTSLDGTQKESASKGDDGAAMEQPAADQSGSEEKPSDTAAQSSQSSDKQDKAASDSDKKDEEAEPVKPAGTQPVSTESKSTESTTGKAAVPASQTGLVVGEQGQVMSATQPAEQEQSSTHAEENAGLEPPVVGSMNTNDQGLDQTATTTPDATSTVTETIQVEAADQPAMSVPTMGGEWPHGDERARELVRMVEQNAGFSSWYKREAIEGRLKMVWGGNEGLKGVLAFSTDLSLSTIDLDDGTLMVYDGSNAWVSPQDIEFPRARFHLLTWPYFIAVQFKLSDPGVNVQYMGETLWRDGKKLPAFRMTFGDGIGDTPEDWYIVYVDPVGRAVAGMSYIVTYGTSVAEAQKTIHAIVYDDYARVGGVAVPHRMSFYDWTPTEGVKGEKLGEVTFMGAKFISPDKDYFVRPDSARQDMLPKSSP
ncbi:hypothetical protein [Poriferisphaera sp. WC338]|uniref:hypothetical protein n=1 Tax=Poriferisphaera sp. WC338 TaxID=3425129 RepID=UPI003D81A15A